MPRRKALDVVPLVDLFAAEVARQLSRELQRRWDQLDAHLTRVEQAIRNRPAPELLAEDGSATQQCGIAGCGRPVRAKGLCGAHYQQLRYRLARQDDEPAGDAGQPEPESTTEVAPRPSATHMVIRRKARPSDAEVAAEPSAVPPSEAPSPAPDTRAIHPALRPIV